MTEVIKSMKKKHWSQQNLMGLAQIRIFSNVKIINKAFLCSHLTVTKLFYSVNIQTINTKGEYGKTKKKCITSNKF